MTSVYRYRCLIGGCEGITKVYPILGFALHYYPPLFSCSSIPIYAIFGLSKDVATFSNLIFLAILIFSVYGIGKKVYSKRVGLLSVFIISMYPLIINLSRDYLIDLSLISMVSLNVYILLLTERFSNLKYSIVFGVTFGLGMLSKWTFIIFIAGPLFYIILKEIRGISRKELMDFKKILSKKFKNPFTNFVIFLIIGVCVASVWYAPEWKNFINNLNQYSTAGIAEGDPQWNSLEGLLYYPLNYIDQVSFFYAIIFVTGLYFYIKSKDKYKIFWILSLIIPYVVFTIVSNKDVRFLSPILPSIALISAKGILNMRQNYVRYALLLIILIFGTTQFFLLTYDFSLPPPQKIHLYGASVSFPYPNGFYPQTQDWKIKEVLNEINSTKHSKKSIVEVIVDKPYFNDINFPYYSYLNKHGIKLMIGPSMNPLKADYIITTTGTISDGWRKGQFERAYNFFKKHLSEFSLIKKFKLPDNSTALLYKRK
jgi:4-amino-4-deoxy-L-arabinose transferase-like glycosyltransferase